MNQNKTSVKSLVRIALENAILFNEFDNLESLKEAIKIAIELVVIMEAENDNKGM